MRDAWGVPQDGGERPAEGAEMDRIDLLIGSFGCSDSTGHVGVDPYRRHLAAGERWHDVAAGDGGSYSGVAETVTRREGESEADFEERAYQRAKELDVQWHCSRCS